MKNKIISTFLIIQPALVYITLLIYYKFSFSFSTFISILSVLLMMYVIFAIIKYKNFNQNIKKMNSFEKKFKRFGQKIMIPLIWFAIVLFLLAIIVLTYYTLTKSLDGKSIVIILFNLFIFYLIWILFVSVTKYKKETLLDDIERKAKWESLSHEYKRFYRHLHILGISLAVFMFISGIWLLAIKDPYGWLMLILGVNLMVLNTIISRRKNER